MSVNYIDHIVDQESGVEYEIVDTAARVDISDLKSQTNNIDEVIYDTTVTIDDVSVDGQVVTGYVWRHTAYEAVESSTRAYAKYLINGAQKIYVTGGSAAVIPNFALCGAYDANDNLLETYGNDLSTDYTDYEIQTHADTAYIIVNGTYRVVAGSRVLVIGVKIENVDKDVKVAFKDELIEIDDTLSFEGKAADAKVVGDALSAIDTSGFVPAKMTYTDEGITVVYGKYFRNSTMTPTDSVGCSYIDYSIPENQTIEKIKFSGKNGNSSSSLWACAFYNSEDTVLDHYGTQNTEYTDVILDVPTGTKRIIINGFYYTGSAINPNQPHAKLSVQKTIDIYEETDERLVDQWKGKKITLLGTSVAFGAKARTNYINEASKILGFSVFNTGVPGGSITVTESDGVIYPVGNTGYSSVMSIAEYTAADITVPSDTSDSHYYCSWERIFTSEANDTDLFIFACIPNNTNFALTDWEAFDKESWSYPNSETFADHRQTFLGGLLFLMDKMYTFKSDARMCLLIDTSIGLSNDSKTAIKTIAEYYNIPLIDLWGKIQTTPQMLTLLKSENGTNNHPSTFAHELMGKMLAGELLSVF